MRNFVALTMAAAFVAAMGSAFAGDDRGRQRVTLKPCRVEGVKEELRCGVYHVFENRETRKRRKLPLKIIVIPARHPHPERGPIFYMAGGPGEAATDLVSMLIEAGDAEEHDVVLVDHRGTGEGHRLDCARRVSDDNLEAYLNGPFHPAAARACRDKLEKQFDLTQYSTPNFVEDIDEVRGAMGYERINLSAGSFGTYAAMMYMRRHPERVRAAWLSSVTPVTDRVPLYFAEAAQLALNRLFAECEQDDACRAAYPRLRDDFEGILKKLRDGPVLTTVRHPGTGARTEIHLSERAFGDAIRLMMYRKAYELPFLIAQATKGDFSAFAEEALRVNRAIYSAGTMGLHYAITCGEFVSRIRPQEVDAATRGTFLGAWRVRDQMEACKDWPKSTLPGDLFEPFQLDVPAMLVSTEADPASSNDRWAKEIASSMPGAVQLTIPGVGHPRDNECTRSIRHAFFRTGTTEGLDLSCVAKSSRPAFKLPANGNPPKGHPTL